MSETPAMLLSVIIPARNEADVLTACLASLIAQSEPGFALGTEWELLVVSDDSTDGTAAIAEAHPGVTLLNAPPLDLPDRGGFTGKNAACWTGAQAAHGCLLLFTDADTVHEPGNLSRARHELEKYGVGLLSYSPRQIVTGIAQRALMPIVFAELAQAYPPRRVNLPEDRIAAANGQFMLFDAEAYFAVGGHRAVGTQVLEDVALARNIKCAKRGLRFRYAPDALSTRMYRSTAAMLEGWTKNLALLFASPLLLAAMRLLDLLLIAGLPVLGFTWRFLGPLQKILILVVWLRVLWRFFARTSRSHFPWADNVLALAGLPLFVYLLLASTLQVRLRKAVQWKSRTIPVRSQR